jgi:hypothetical protein
MIYNYMKNISFRIPVINLLRFLNVAVSTKSDYVEHVNGLAKVFH